MSGVISTRYRPGVSVRLTVAAHEFDLRRGDEARGDRISYLVFDEVRRASFPIGIDDYLHVAQVGNRVQRCPLQSVNACSYAEDREDDDQELVAGARREAIRLSGWNLARAE